jgi:hypothetical protein
MGVCKGGEKQEPGNREQGIENEPSRQEMHRLKAYIRRSEESIL